MSSSEGGWRPPHEGMQVDGQAAGEQQQSDAEPAGSWDDDPADLSDDEGQQQQWGPAGLQWDAEEQQWDAEAGQHPAGSGDAAMQDAAQPAAAAGSEGEHAAQEVGQDASAGEQQLQAEEEGEAGFAAGGGDELMDGEEQQEPGQQLEYDPQQVDPQQGSGAEPPDYEQHSSDAEQQEQQGSGAEQEPQPAFSGEEGAIEDEPLPPGEGGEEEDAAAQEALEAAQHKLNELEAQLRQPDAVMEPGIMDRLREYVMANGHPQAAVEYLTDSYVGYAQMASLERFDPQLFATVFTSGGSGAPQWLNGLIAEPEGRQLVYELAGRYKNSLLLNFAIHKILMQPGREKEVAAVGGSLAGYFGVFHRLMAAKLREAAAAADERALETLARGLKEDCCASQHTYVHAQQVLCELVKHPHGARFRRLAQELEAHAAALHGPVVWKMRQWFAEPGQPESHYAVAALLSDILASSASGAPPASEMAKLHRFYWPQEPGQDIPPIAFLRHPRIIEVLLANLFSPSRQLQPEAVHAYSGLLALAAAADDQRPNGPADGLAAAAAADGAGSSGEEAAQQQQQQQQGGGGGQLDLAAVPATRAALEAAAELAQRVMQDQKSTQEDMETAAAVLEYPVCAAGLLRALGTQLSRPDYWQTAYHLLKSPPFLTLLSLMVPRQPALHTDLLQLLGRALTAMGNTNHDMAKGFLSIAVQLVSAGRVFEVLRWAEEWKARADPSLVRHLVFGILEVSAPPYSPEFAGSMLRIMMAAGIRRQRLSARDWGIKALLDEFSAACAQVQFKPPLTAREAQFLQDISADRPPGY
ncbi:Negative elongation factor D [Chlorella sorokiniana]|uniref:Negative elongation factor D n=1 Tax=Chlorella sorokiniana TaxID=3076 RepID=A0A2P6U1X3_CHLSO|nr:Negative elongation factor D [Chlorella sorokiniana]|eukprot:PRW60315.1 Negative elongation factor D [Chlorella sorokiniana]